MKFKCSKCGEEFDVDPSTPLAREMLAKLGPPKCCGAATVQVRHLELVR